MYQEPDVIRWAKSMVGSCPNPHHEKDLNEHHFCPGCGEALTIYIRKGDRVTLWRGPDGEVIAAVKNHTIHILDKEKVRAEIESRERSEAER